MRILILSQYFWPESFRINDLAVSLHKRGYDVIVLTGFPHYPAGKVFPGYSVRPWLKETYEGVTIVRVPLYPYKGYSLLRRSWNHLSFALSASLMGPFLVGQVDRILVFQVGPITVGIPAIVLKYLKKAPVIFWVQDIWPDTLEATGLVRRSWILSLVRRLVQFIYRHCDLIPVQSRGFARRVAQLGVPPEKVQYLPNWAEELYRPVPRNDGMAVTEGMADRFIVMFAGNIGRSQDFDTLLGAAALLKDRTDIQFVILGDGAMAQHYLELSRRQGLSNVVFKGKKPVEWMPRYFALADVLLVQLRNEPIFALTIPSKLQSYLACGRPIVAALKGDPAAIVSDSGGGVVCMPGDPIALAEAVLHVYRKSPEEREALAKAGTAYYHAEFDRSMLLDRFDALLNMASVGRAHTA